MSPLGRHLLPDTASVGADGWLRVGRCSLQDLAEEFGTPLFVYDEDHLRARCREAVAAFGPGVAYASKAFLCLAMARLVHEEGMHIDVATLGEIHVALAAGVPPGDLVFHGNNKDDASLRFARSCGVGRIVVDSFDELARLESLHQEDGLRPRVLLRVTPGVEAHTHEFVRTGQEDSKFGFTLTTGMARTARNIATNSNSVELVGLHMHIGSQVFVADFFRQAVEAISDFARDVALPELSIGGGIGVAYLNEDRAPTISEWAASIHEAAATAGLTARVTAEPGRAIAASAGMTVYRIGTVKALPGIRTYVSVDGGMSDNPRPILYGSEYEAFLPRSPFAPRDTEARIVGMHCESGDVVVREAILPGDFSRGDLVATPVTGAYGYSMSSNYNKALRPAVVFVSGGEARVVVRRETVSDLMRLDVPPPDLVASAPLDDRAAIHV